MQEEKNELVCKALSNSPFYLYLGMEVKEISDKQSRLEMTLKPEHKNIWGTIHGGVLASILDSACGSSIYSSLSDNEGAMTLDLKVNYISKATDGRLTVKGRFIHRTKTIAFSEAEAFDEKGNLIARATAIHRIIGRSWNEKQNQGGENG